MDPFHDHQLFLIKSQVFVGHIPKLPVYDQGSRNDDDGDGELNNNQCISQPGGTVVGAGLPFSAKIGLKDASTNEG